MSHYRTLKRPRRDYSVKVIRSKPEPLNLQQAVIAGLRRERTKQMRELKRMEWDWERNPSPTMTELLKFKRLMVSDIERRISDAHTG